MCGICGKVYLDARREVEGEVIDRMMQAMIHRGPDQGGKRLMGHVGLGHRRLSIIDLASGGQPLGNEDGRIWIVFNGEIYNFGELREELSARGHAFRTRTDTEVIVHLYEDLGERCLTRLRGMFALALYDGRRDRLLVARDRLGIKPLYYLVSDDRFLFASEIKALLQDPAVPALPDLQGVHHFLRHTYTPGPRTAFRNIRKLRPGTFIVVEGGRMRVEEYWSLRPFYAPGSNVRRKVEEDLLGLLRETVALHEISDVPIGFLLSGGVDSTATLCLSQESGSGPLKTFTIGFGGESFEDERVYAREAAHRYGAEHHEMTLSSREFMDFLPGYVWFMEEPVFEPPAVALYYVTRMAREHVKVLLSGEGGDECFAGYQTYRNLAWLERVKGLLGECGRSAAARLFAGVLRGDRLGRYIPLMSVPLETYYNSRAYGPAGPFGSGPGSVYSEGFREAACREPDGAVFRERFGKMNGMSPLQKMLYVDALTWLPDRLLVKADKMTMANSLELRVPLLDHRLMEFAAGIPDAYKVSGLRTKHIFKEVLKGRVSDAILQRKKLGFALPYDRWLWERKDFVLSVLTDPAALGRGYFDGRALRKAVLEPWARTGRGAREVFSLLVLELWHRMFIDGGPQADPPSLHFQGALQTM